MTPPQPDELELSLFGPGVGECAVIHLGEGDWMVVDSCAHGPDRTPAALAYLESIDVDVSRQVKLIVVTHWHDDHIQGLAKLVRQAGQAQFACSAALQNQEFLVLVSGDRDIRMVANSSGVEQFSEVLDILEKRPGSYRTIGPDHWASEGKLLFQRGAPSQAGVWALSPSSQTISDAHRSLADIVPRAGQPIRRFHHPKPNELSVALMVCAPTVQFLLGGDLETGRSTRHGWRAVLASNTIPGERATAYKVAHHGSENADLAGIWEEYLIAQPFALLTPYGKGRKPLPSGEDIARMKGRTERLYCTAWPPTCRPPRRESAVMRTMKETVRNHWAVPATMGHIRLRISINEESGPVDVVLNEGAVRL